MPTVVAAASTRQSVPAASKRGPAPPSDPSPPPSAAGPAAYPCISSSLRVGLGRGCCRAQRATAAEGLEVGWRPAVGTPGDRAAGGALAPPHLPPGVLRASMRAQARRALPYDTVHTQHSSAGGQDPQEGPEHYSPAGWAVGGLRAGPRLAAEEEPEHAEREQQGQRGVRGREGRQRRQRVPERGRRRRHLHHDGEWGSVGGGGGAEGPGGTCVAESSSKPGAGIAERGAPPTAAMVAKVGGCIWYFEIPSPNTTAVCIRYRIRRIYLGYYGHLASQHGGPLCSPIP
jgi:hypothetical protein